MGQNRRDKIISRASPAPGVSAPEILTEPGMVVGRIVPPERHEQPPWRNPPSIHAIFLALNLLMGWFVDHLSIPKTACICSLLAKPRHFSFSRFSMEPASQTGERSIHAF